MARILMVYGSTTGNTEQVAEWIETTLSSLGHEVTIKNVIHALVSDLGVGYDLTLLGSSTWGDEEIEFQDDFAPFFEELDTARLRNKPVALFGCGDSSYPHFCGAVDLLESRMDELGAMLIVGSLRIDGDPSVSRADIEAWAREIHEAIPTRMERASG